MRVFYFILCFSIVSCTESNGTQHDNENGDTLLFKECFENSYPELTSKIYEFLPLEFPNCRNFDVYYKSLSKGQIDTTELFKDYSIENYMNNVAESDSSVLSQKFEFEDLEQCSNGNTYKKNSKCAFYIGGVYISQDRSLQIVRLYQEGEDQIFDMFIRVQNSEIEILAFG